MTPVQESVKQGRVVIVEDDVGNALTLELLLLSETTNERSYSEREQSFLLDFIPAVLSSRQKSATPTYRDLPLGSRNGSYLDVR